MLLGENSLLYCAYSIAVFDLLCAVLFSVLSLGLILSHLSWLTIFCVCLGIFWVTLILLLISGIYTRDSDMVRYWLIFSCFGIFVELILIVYAFLSHSTFQAGVIQNSFILCLGLFVETIFAFIIYQFYLAVSRCNVCVRRRSTPDCACNSQRSQPLIQQQSQPESCESPSYRRSSRRSPQSYRCNILQNRAATSPYTCGPKSSYSTVKWKTDKF
ncbi:uncharacterized protein LOC117787882 [Drosophila innubila]|uniref:uncharacterized protein LOC117787882 n=1 Tax=Drosophila innubila TaxID=198719 RepID=UPI00148B6228|nr:uncharacterized protein LOC117787882 [Drosophila innubila]